MGRKTQKKKPILTEAILPTPERLAKDIAEQVNPALIDSKQPIGQTTRITQSTVDRWQASGRLTERNMVAINHCYDLWWEQARAKLVQDLNAIRGPANGDGLRQHEALAQLAQYKSRVAEYDVEYWSVFENVVRHDESGGVAGSNYANDNGRASMAALMIVRFVCDIICKMKRF